MTQVLSDMLIRVGYNGSEAERGLQGLSLTVNNLVGNLKIAGAGGGRGGQGGGIFGGLFGDMVGINQAWNLAKKVVGAIKDTFEFGMEGAQISSLRTASIKLAAGYGTSMRDIVNSVQEASYNTISEYSAMKAANLAMTMGVSTDADKLGQLMQISMLRARAFGLTTEEAFDRITRGIGRRSNKILDDLGFTANATYANNQYAESIGKTAYELTDAERVQAIFTQILKQGNAELKQQGGLNVDAATGMQRANVAYEEFMNRAKERANIGMWFLSDKEKTNMYKEQAGIEILGGTYDRYLESYASYAGMVYDMGDLKQQDLYLNNKLTASEYALAQSIGVKNAQYAKGQITEWAMGIKTTESIQQQIEVFNSLQIATTAEAAAAANLTEIQQKYNEEILKNQPVPGKKGDINYGAINAAYKEGEQGIKDWVYQAAMAGLSAEEDGFLIREMGLAMGQFTEAEWQAADAMDQLNNARKTQELGWKEYLEMTGKVSAGLTTIMAGGQSDYYIDVWYRTHGGAGWGNLGKEGDVNLWNLPSIKKPMHGGSFVGLQHGGMIPPGFYSDSYPIRVTSGERVDVTPAGNKTIENTALLSKLDELNFKFDGLPRAIRDAVQTIV